ncbi:MAG: peptide chain release factor 1 [Actinomycetota bacterium]
MASDADSDSDFHARLREIEERYEDVQREMSSPEVGSDPDRLRDLGRTFSELRDVVEPYRAYAAAVRQATDARDMAAAESEPEMAAYLKDEAVKAERTADELRGTLELTLVPTDPDDGKDLLVEIRAGTGGQEAALWAGDLVEMYRRYAERHRWKTDVLSSSPSEAGGFKDTVIEVRGKDAYSHLKWESGVHRVQRIPATESSGRIHTSTATVAVMPEVQEVEVEIRPEDLKIDVYRSSGPGGQSVNTTDSAVRITHLPTGTVASCQEERSQLQNREKAMRYLRARLYQQALDQRQREEADSRRSQVGTGERAEKIRTYNFPENRVTDHRIKLTVHRLSEVLAGDLDGFTDALISANRTAQLAHGDDAGT